MINVAFNATALLSPLTGIGQYALHLATGLQALPDLKMEFFYRSHFSQEIKRSDSSANQKFRVWARRNIPNAYKLRQLLEQQFFNAGVKKTAFDVYHEPNYLPMRFDGPTVITVHDLSWIRYPETHPIERVRAMDRYFEPALRNAALLLTDSHFVKREIIDVFGVEPDRIMPVALGLDPIFRPMPASETQPVLSKHALTHGQYFLSVGTLEPRKNVQATVTAYSRLPQEIRARYPLVMAGMKGWRTSAMEQLLDPLVQSGQVRMLGYLERSELAAVTAGALAMVYPSLYEGFGLPPLEAMGCAVPPITSNVSSLPEVVGDDTGLTVDPSDVVALSQAMESLACDPALRASLASKSQVRAAQFTWTRCADETAQAYRLAATSSR